MTAEEDNRCTVEDILKEVCAWIEHDIQVVGRDVLRRQAQKFVDRIKRRLEFEGRQMDEVLHSAADTTVRYLHAEKRAMKMTVALHELSDRISYHCARTDGTYNPPFVKEWVEIVDSALRTDEK